MITKDERKSLKIRYSGRSSDWISPSFDYGCFLKCRYCYMRRHKPEGISFATNIDKILFVIDKHVNNLDTKLPNQTHSKYWTYDIGCNTDISLNLKHQDYFKIFDYFKYSTKAFGTFATKYVNEELLNYNPNHKIRIRFSLLPQILSYIVEPNTSLIEDRIKAVNSFYEAGYDVHLNFSPVIITEDSKKLYTELFQMCDSLIDNSIKDTVLAEVIFLTHNEKLHNHNISCDIDDSLLWTPDIQENKISQYGGDNVRYKRAYKKIAIERFKKLHDSIIPWNKIRYIF